MKAIYDLRLAEITSVNIEFSSSQLDPIILKGTFLCPSNLLHGPLCPSSPLSLQGNSGSFPAQY